ncbi:MAG: sugar phosphate isomerase/epimerase [Syntrophales bacterium]|nr:sugar phosphate isomerase/epimerase [Syntrophales bacterium]
MDAIPRNVQIHVPFTYLLEHHKSLILEKKINPEIYFNAQMLDSYNRSELEFIGSLVKKFDLSVTIHAPYMDLRPGALDPKIRQISIERIVQVIKLIPVFHPRTIVCHPSFDPRYYSSTEDLWVENSLSTWSYLISLINDTETVICLENVYETHPRPLRRVLEICSSPRLRFCFDTGHFNCFSKVPLESWIEDLAPYMEEIHLHDNLGETDQHLPIGEGTFPFEYMLTLLKKKNIKPILTLEAHSESTLNKFLNNLRKFTLP